MTTAEWISLGSSIGALAAASISLFTLLELFKQRRASYLPDLCLVQKRFQLKQSDYMDIKLPLIWHDVNGEQSSFMYFATIELLNVGFGAAKNISVKWEFDELKFVEAVNQLAQETHQPFFITENDGTLRVNVKEGKGCSGSTKHSFNQFEYLLPLNHGSTGREISVPSSYTMLTSIYLSLFAVKSPYNDFCFDDVNIPRLQLKLQYYDIGKRKIRSSHLLECYVGSISKDDKDQPTGFGVTLRECS
ncbi:hypothetical protein [Shewanella halifaxensis]|uniref:hypothetical protein n=1 Tax=Shewanella halifaxensis TaxID=271098 RepID=UPI000D59EDC1|nr:hypothetical protein [Shewanella halifaxensis]